ncbi:MAG: GH39 family glycosyl hydrolase [Chitinispirillaceae bacterium]
MFRECMIFTLVCSALAFAQDGANGPVAVNVDGSTVINTLSEQFFGHNYWMWCPTWGEQMEGTEELISDLDLGLLRFGGISVDLGYPDPVSESVLADFASYCGAVGAQPLLQLQIGKYTTTEQRVANASAMLSYFKTQSSVRYVSIGNEPDIYPENQGANPDYGAQHLQEYTLEDYCSDFNAIASEIRKIDPEIKIIGLELSHKYSEWIPEFVSRCRENVDIISVHYYPYAANGCTYRNAYNQSNKTGSFYSSVRDLIDRNADGKEIPMLVGETNISWDGDPANSVYDASPGTFNAALWFGEFVGISTSQENLLSIMPWSIREGWTLGFLNGSREPKPVYYVYKMFAENVKKHLIHKENVNSFVRVFAYKDDEGNASLYAINWDTTSSYDVSFNFTGFANDTVLNYTVPAHSISCLTFSAVSESWKITEYTSEMESDPPATSAINLLRSKESLRAGQFTVDVNRVQNSMEITSSARYTDVSLSILDLKGKVIGRTSVGTLTRGVNRVNFSKDIPAGVHLLKMTSGKRTLARVRIE